MSSAGPQAHPIFQPVQLNILAALEIVTVRLGHAGVVGQRNVAVPVEHQMLVDLVGDHQQVGVHSELGQRVEFVVGGHHAGRVVRRIDDQRLGLGCDRPPQPVDVDREAAPVLDQRHRTPLAAGHRDDGGVRVVERLDQQHLGARFDEPEDRRGDGLGGADGDQHLGVGVVLGAEVAFALRGDRLAQRRDAKAGRVLVDALGDGVLGDLEHRGRPVLVGEALAEVHRADAGGQRRHLGEDRDRVGLESPHRHGCRA